MNSSTGIIDVILSPSDKDNIWIQDEETCK